MGRPPGYGRLGGSRRRNAGAIWGWLIMGGIFGFSCAVIVVLGLVIGGVLNLDDGVSVAELPTFTPAPTQDVQGTVDAAVIAAIGATLTAQPTNTAQPTPGPAQISAPTPTSQITATTQSAEPTEEAVAPQGGGQPTQQPAPTATSQTTTGGGTTGLTSAGGGSETVEVPTLLAGILTTLRPVQGGTFEMGTNQQEVQDAVRECTDRDGGQCLIEYGADSIPAHSVTLDSFQIEETEVSNRQYVAFLNSLGPGSHEDGCGGRVCAATSTEDINSPIRFDGANYTLTAEFQANFPVGSVSWYGADAYCQAVGRRLPTEAEWEFAARGTDSATIYPWGSQWVEGNANVRIPLLGVTGNEGPLEVNTLPGGRSITSGALHMAGNQAEWVADWYQSNFYLQPASGGLNPTGPASGVNKVLRGGSWDTPPFFARVVHRQDRAPDVLLLWIGFRCAADAEEQPLSGPGLNPFEPIEEATEAPLGAAPTLPSLDLPPTPQGGQ
jgi:formylglycine-generating enzyme required for sulfatase activity